MSEMLANRYFLAGRFSDAAVQYEAVLRKCADHVQARKKLIVCYALTGRIREALELAAGLLRRDMLALLQTDPVAEGFPWIEPGERCLSDAPRMDEAERHACLGLLSLFTDEGRALRELDLALQERPSMTEARGVRHLVERHLAAGMGG